jgi:flagellar protein FliL
VAENNAAKATPTAGQGASGGKPIILYVLVILNMLVVAGVGAMVYLGKQKELSQANTIDKVVTAVAEDAAKTSENEEDFIGKMIPMETFLVNLSGTRGNKVLKVNMELEVEGAKIAEEIDKRKPQLRDIIIILLSSKTYTQLSSAEGKEFLREEIRDTVNSFLTKGRIKRVHFTEFIFN